MKVIKSFVYAAKGIGYCFKNELNFKIHLLAAGVIIVMGFWLSINIIEWLFIIACCSLVLAMEMLNTAMEKMCDMVSKEFNLLIKIIKDVSAGAVFVCAVGSCIIGALIFIPKIIHQFKF